MDREIWQWICRAVHCADRRIPRLGRKPEYSDQLIVKMFFWACFFHMPRCWACDRNSYTSLARPRRLPSVSQFCKRLHSQRVLDMIEAVNAYLLEQAPSTVIASFDGQPMELSNNTTDPDAHCGYANGRIRNGYKNHACVDENGFIRGHIVHPMNVAEPSTARQSLVDVVEPDTLILADGNFDSAPLYEALEARGATLITPLKGQSTSPARLERMPMGRRLMIDMWHQARELVSDLYRRRDNIERRFGNLVCVRGGLHSLPPFVRRLKRVRPWVAAKICLYHARLLARLCPS